MTFSFSMPPGSLLNSNMEKVGEEAEKLPVFAVFAPLNRFAAALFKRRGNGPANNSSGLVVHGDLEEAQLLIFAYQRAQLSDREKRRPS